ncbi:MAG: hypothetical protein ACP5HG_14205 [Anaerolineae bacterium]
MHARYLRAFFVAMLTLLLLAFPRGTTAQLDMPPREADREAPAREVLIEPAGAQALAAQITLAPIADTYNRLGAPDTELRQFGPLSRLQFHWRQLRSGAHPPAL